LLVRLTNRYKVVPNLLRSYFGFNLRFSSVVATPDAVVSVSNPNSRRRAAKVQLTRGLEKYSLDLTEDDCRALIRLSRPLDTPGLGAHCRRGSNR
jgi:hypothetical protein